MPRILTLIVLLGLTLPVHAADDGPKIVHVGAVSTKILALTIETGIATHQSVTPYVKQASDVEVTQSRPTDPMWLIRQGKVIGALGGPKKDHLLIFETLAQTPLDTTLASERGSYEIRVDGARSMRPTAVYRKSKPTDMIQVAEWRFEYSMRHTIYLELPEPLVAGSNYEILIRSVVAPNTTYEHDPDTVRSEAVHASQLGYRPDDPIKRGYLSCWMGDGGKIAYDPPPSFAIIDEATGKSVLDGKAVLGFKSDQPEDVRLKNHNGADIYHLDFSSLKTPGRYRIRVDGIGCSYGFAIGPNTWRDAFFVSARGLYHQRSGIELKPPYTTFTRPRMFHPDDGMKIYASMAPLIDTSNGLNARGTDTGNFQNLVNGKTLQIIPDAWGGYCDAGDWDRRIQHLNASRYLLELVELFPEYFERYSLNIPESGNDIPDLIDEAMFGLDVYRRMQTPEGGIRGGIESAEHPRFGETSWLESLEVFAYAPDAWSSFEYAGVAARTAFALRDRKPDLAKMYQESAIRAMRWGLDHAHHEADKVQYVIRDSSNLAALELYRLTGDKQWEQVFLKTTLFNNPYTDMWDWEKQDQSDAAFLIARMDSSKVDQTTQKYARNAVLREGDRLAVRTASTGFNWANRNVYGPVAVSALTTPMIDHVRAFHLSSDAKYLTAAVLACQSGAGANPVNICYTTGLGQASVQHPLIVDQRRAGFPVYPGITIFGPLDYDLYKDSFAVQLIEPVIYPPQEIWPTSEAHFDMFLHPMMNEYTVQSNIAPNLYVWGYLAARK